MILSEAYREIMDHLTVTQEMRRRILDNVENGRGGRKKRGRALPVRAMAAAACLALVLAGAAVLRFPASPAAEGPGVHSGRPEAAEADSCRDLSRLVGFPVEEARELPFPVTEVKYEAWPGGLAQVTYLGEEASLVFRKIPGDQDPSGDYTDYSQQTQITVDGRQVTLKGEDGGYVLALWEEDGYSCSMRASPACWEETWLRVLESME